MKVNILPEHKFYTIHTLAEKWGCSVDIVLNYALTGQLQLSLESQGWKIEYGSIEGDDDGRWFSIPERIKHSRHDLFRLSLRDQKELIKCGTITNPSFKEEEYDYVTAISDIYGEDVVAHLNDVLVLSIDANAIFEKASESNSAITSVDSEKDEIEFRKAIDSVPYFYKEGIKIYGKILQDTGKDPSLKAVVRAVHQLKEFNHFPFETISRHMNKKELIKRYQNSKKR